MIWKLIKNAIHDIERMNAIKLGDQSWARLKELEQAIYEWQRQVDSVGEPTWQYLSMYQQHILRGSANQHGTTILRNEEDKIREARQLEDMKLVTIEFNPRSSFSGAYWIRITPEGRKVLSQKESGRE